MQTFPTGNDNVVPLSRHASRKCAGAIGRRSASHGIAMSVVVPTLKRPRLLERCLAALARCHWEKAWGGLEVIVVDDGPDAVTRVAAEQARAMFAARAVDLRYLPSHGPHGPAAARNRGWRAASGRIIAFTDDDTEPERGWLAAGRRAFDHGAEAAWGTLVVPIPAQPTDYELDVSGLARAGFVTANCFCLRALLQRVGGFDPRFRLAWREDSDLYFGLLRSGARIDYVADAVVIHPTRPARWGVSLRQQRKVMFDALLYRKHPQLYRRRIRPRARWDYYFIVAAAALGVAAAIGGRAEIALGAGAIWLAATLAFAFKRLRATPKTPSHVAEMLLTSAAIPPLVVFWRLYGAFKFRTVFL